MSQSPIRFASNDPEQTSNSPIRLGGKPPVVKTDEVVDAAPKVTSARESAEQQPPHPSELKRGPVARVEPNSRGLVSSEATAIAGEDSLASAMEDVDF